MDLVVDASQCPVSRCAEQPPASMGHPSPPYRAGEKNVCIGRQRGPAFCVVGNGVCFTRSCARWERRPNTRPGRSTFFKFLFGAANGLLGPTRAVPVHLTSRQIKHIVISAEVQKTQSSSSWSVRPAQDQGSSESSRVEEQSNACPSRPVALGSPLAAGGGLPAKGDLPGRLRVEPWSGATRGAGSRYRPEP